MFFKLKKFCAIVVMSFTALTTFSEAQSETPFWLTGDFSIDNSVGIGTFVSGYAQTPQWATSFTLSPRAQLPLPALWPKIFVSADISANVWWLNSIQTSAFDANHRIQFPDLVLTLSSPTIFEIEKIGISFSALLPVIIPVSRSSRVLNRIFALGFGSGIKWKKSQFSVRFVPSALAWIHGGESKTIDCFDSDTRVPSLGVANPDNPDFAIDQYMLSLAVFRDEESSDGETCAIVGRQNLWTIKNTLDAAWSNPSHHVSVGLTYYWNFLRPLEDRPELAGMFSSSQSFTQAVLGKVAYTYTLPLDFEMAVSTGVLSYQSVFSKMGTPLFPFFDFATPAKNQTQVFVELVASI